MPQDAWERFLDWSKLQFSMYEIDIRREAIFYPFTGIVSNASEPDVDIRNIDAAVRTYTIPLNESRRDYVDSNSFIREEVRQPERRTPALEYKLHKVRVDPVPMRSGDVWWQATCTCLQYRSRCFRSRRQAENLGTFHIVRAKKGEMREQATA
jgi:hypothetical protein